MLRMNVGQCGVPQVRHLQQLVNGFPDGDTNQLVGSTAKWLLVSLSRILSPGFCAPSFSYTLSYADHLSILGEAGKTWASKAVSPMAREAGLSLGHSHTSVGGVTGHGCLPWHRPVPPWRRVMWAK